MKKSKNSGWLIVIIMIALILIIGLPIIIGTISAERQTIAETNNEKRLIEEGKVETTDEVINQIVEILKEKDTQKLELYLAKDFAYYDNDNYESKYINSFIRNLTTFTSSYEIERRGDIKQNDEATYLIYWNVVEKNKENGIKKQNLNYCLQRITICLKRVVKTDKITYEIQKIILKNN